VFEVWPDMLSREAKKIYVFVAASTVLIFLLTLVLGRSPTTAGKAEITPQIAEKGVAYEHYAVREVPWSINVIRIDRSRTNLELVTTLGRGSQIGLSTLTQQLRTLPSVIGKPLAAINGDFYALEGNTYQGDPRGLHIMRGELVSGPIPRTCFWLDENGSPQLGEVAARFFITWANGEKSAFGLNEERSGADPVLYTSAIGDSTRTYNGVEFVLEKAGQRNWLPLRAGENLSAKIRKIHRGGDTAIEPGTMVLSFHNLSQDAGAAAAKAGDVITISTATQPSLKGVRTALGGGPILVHNGKAAPGRALKSGERHPRSAIGWNEKEFFFVEVDGRQRGFSVGMNVPELANFMAKLGCTEAMNLDGGGSAELWLKGRIMNSPCFGRERHTATALVLLEKSGSQTDEEN